LSQPSFFVFLRSCIPLYVHDLSAFTFLFLRSCILSCYIYFGFRSGKVTHIELFWRKIWRLFCLFTHIEESKLLLIILMSAFSWLSR
jgi:hypothetical protein